MKQDIKHWVIKICIKFNLEAIYFPDNDVYSIRFKGRGIQNFTSKIFYELPKRHRQNMIRAILKLGLNHNAGEKRNLILNRKLGRKIY
jgi:hypothetical protein